MVSRNFGVSEDNRFSGVLDQTGRKTPQTFTILEYFVSLIRGRIVKICSPYSIVDEKSQNSTFNWEDLCFRASKDYGLSRREEEVFYLLSIGRNTQRISRVLGISNHTAKSHIYHIYQKMMIHTQQEAIDIVEKYAVFD